MTMIHCPHCDNYFNEDNIIVDRDGDSYSSETVFREPCPICFEVIPEGIEE